MKKIIYLAELSNHSCKIGQSMYVATRIKSQIKDLGKIIRIHIWKESVYSDIQIIIKLYDFGHYQLFPRNKSDIPGSDIPGHTEILSGTFEELSSSISSIIGSEHIIFNLEDMNCASEQNRVFVQFRPDQSIFIQRIAENEKRSFASVVRMIVDYWLQKDNK